MAGLSLRKRIEIGEMSIINWERTIKNAAEELDGLREFKKKEDDELAVLKNQENRTLTGRNLGESGGESGSKRTNTVLTPPISEP